MEISNTILKYRQLIESNPNNPNINQYYKEIGKYYEKERDFYKAITEGYVKILKTEPYNGVILNQIGCCYNLLSQHKLAIHYFKKVLQIKEIPDVYANIGICYNAMKDYTSAEEVLLKAHKLDKTKSNVQSILGDIYFYTKQYEKSIKYYSLMKDTNDSYKHLYNLSFAYLAKLDFKKGLDLYENRLKFNTVNPQTNFHDRVEVNFDYWDGIKPCNHLLIVYEQGIGDNIQYFRFIIELSKLHPTMKITYFCRNLVSHLFLDTYENITIVDELFFYQTFDYKMYIMSLPFLLHKTVICPNTENYIKMDETKLVEWKNKLKSLDKPRMKVGIVYNGLLSSFIEKNIPLKEFELLCDLDIDLICIHKKSDIEKDFANLPLEVANKIKCFDIDLDKPFEDTIHILPQLDLLITIDTYVVHLAGVLGIKTWLLLGYSDWRWSNAETSTYWYDSVELIRTKDNKELKSTLPFVKDKLAKLLQNNRL